MPPQNSFLKKLKFEYMNEGETFDFIKGLQNFDFDFFKLIEPIQINETNAIFRCGDNDYLQVSLVDDRLTITGKWQETISRIPRRRCRRVGVVAAFALDPFFIGRAFLHLALAQKQQVGGKKRTLGT